MKWNSFNLISKSISLTKTRMFPFNFKEWFKLLIISLGGHTIRGSGGNYNYTSYSGSTSDINGVGDAFSGISNFLKVHSRLWGGLLLIFLFIGTFVAYITSIFSFIYLESLINKKSYFTFRRNHAKGVSLFLFRFVVGLITLLVFVGLASPYLYHLFKGNPVFASVGPGYILFSIIAAILFFLLLWFWLLFLYDFVVPFMYANEVSAYFALKEVWARVFKNKLEILVYFIARFVLTFAVIFICMLILLISFLIFMLGGGIIFLVGFLIYKIVGLASLFIVLAILLGIIMFLLWIFSISMITLPLTIFIGYFGLVNFEKLTKINILAMKTPPPQKSVSRSKKILIGCFVALAILLMLGLPIGYGYWYTKNHEISFNSFFPGTEPTFNGTLSLKEVKWGLDWSKGECTFPNSNVYSRNETLCIEFIDVSGFEKNDDGINKFDCGLKVWDTNGTLISSDFGFLNEGSNVLKDNKLDSYSITSKLRKYNPGEYTFQIFIYDLISKKVASVNKTIIVNDNIMEEQLVINNLKIGRWIENVCYTKGNNEFTNYEDLCIDGEISGFEKGQDDFNYYEISAELKYNHTLIEEAPSIRGKEGHMFLDDNKLEGPFIFLDLDTLNLGEYNHEMTVIDKISRKRVKMNTTFKLINDEFSGKLNIKDVEIGLDLPNSCQRGKLFFNFWEDLCIVPIEVTGFGDYSDNFNRFDMNLIIKDDSGKIVDTVEGNWDDIYLYADTLNKYKTDEHWLFVDLMNYGEGKYNFELTVHDLVSGRTDTVNGSFFVLK